MMIYSPITQGIAIGLAIVPILERVADPHAKIVLSVLAFVILSWISMWVAEAVAILVAIEIARALKNWWIWVQFTNEEYMAKQACAT